MNKEVCYVDLSQQEVQDIINAYEQDIEKYNKQKEVIDKIKEELNNLYNADQSERNYKVFIKKVDKLLEEIK